MYKKLPEGFRDKIKKTLHDDATPDIFEVVFKNLDLIKEKIIWFLLRPEEIYLTK